MVTHSWLNEEEFDEIQSNFAMEELEETSSHMFNYTDLEPFLMNVTVNPSPFCLVALPLP